LRCCHVDGASLEFGQQDARAQTGTLTLSQAVEIALHKNPRTEVTAAGRTLADAQLQEARSGASRCYRLAKPLLTATIQCFVFGSLLEQGRFGPNNFAIGSLNNPDPLSNFRSAVTVRFPLLDQRQTETRVARAKIGRQQADQKTDLVEQQLRFEVVRAYYSVLLAQARISVADDAIKTAEADVKRARDLFETGLTVHSDLLAAEVQLAEFRQQRIQANAELIISVAALNTALGLSVETPQIIAGELGERSFTVDSVDLLTSQALHNRPDYQQAISSIEASRAQVRGARGEWQPRIDAFATAARAHTIWLPAAAPITPSAPVSPSMCSMPAARHASIRQGPTNLSPELKLSNSRIRFASKLCARISNTYPPASASQWWPRYLRKQVRHCELFRTVITRG
jgi:outer membrane protein TolC